MKHAFWASTLAVVFSILNLSVAMAQTEEAPSFAQKQFYGNRLKAGSLLLNGSFQRTGFAQENVDGLTGKLGLGAGVGMGENVAFVIGYQRDRTRGLFSDVVGQTIIGIQTLSAFQAGLRFLPNTLGGFVQPYIGLDMVLLRDDLRSLPGDEPFQEQRYAGFNIPVGVIVWISTFMSLSMELFNFNLLGAVGEDVQYNAVANAEIKMLNPAFGVSFLINAKKP